MVDRVETVPIGGRRRSWSAVGLVVAAALGVVGVAAIGRQSESVVQESARPAPSTTTVVTPGPPEPSAAAAGSSLSPDDAFAIEPVIRGATGPVRVWLVETAPTDEGPELEVTGVIVAPVGHVELRWTVDRGPVGRRLIPTAVVVRAVDHGIEARRLFRASLPLTLADGPTSVLLEVRPASLGDPDPGAFLRVGVGSGWRVQALTQSNGDRQG